MTPRKAVKTRKTKALSRTYATPALEKGLDVLELLARRAHGLTKSEIARELNRSVSEIFRMLHSLENRHYISRHVDDRYTLTLKILQLANAYPPTERLLAEALPIMHVLAEKSVQSCHLAVLEGGYIVILAQVNAPKNTGFYVKPGSRIHVTEGGSGYILLACCPEAVRERTMREWHRDTGKDVPKELPAELQKIRARGYEERASSEVQGVIDISFPIFDEDGMAIAALTVPYIQRKAAVVSERQVIANLAAASAEISAILSGKHG